MRPIESLYLHFPFCNHLCNYCDFYKHKLESYSQVDDFENQLSAQIKKHKVLLAENNFKLSSLKTFYLGGGTPSLWGDKGVNYLEKLIESNELIIDQNCEFTLEVDPDAWTEKEIDKWISLGVNRFSIGSQAFTEKHIKIMDRTHSLGDIERTLKFMNEKDLNFSVDLMLGLPKSEDRDIISELDKVLKYNPKHLSVYILKTRSNYPHNSILPEDSFIREEYLSVSNFLVNKGYEHYEVSNFAKPGFKSQHNLNYWSYTPVAALGPNGTGLLVFNSQKAIRYSWKGKTIGFATEIIASESLLIEKLFLGLRTSSGLNIPRLLSLNEQGLVSLNKLHNNWREMGFLSQESHVSHTILSPLGYLMSDSVINDIFNIMPESSKLS